MTSIGHVRESMKVPDSGSRPPTFWILDSGFWILDSGFHTIVDSGSKPLWIPNSSPLDSVFQQQKFAGFRISYMGRKWNLEQLPFIKIPEARKKYCFVSQNTIVHIDLPPNMTCKLSFSKRAHACKFLLLESGIQRTGVLIQETKTT